jgi:hypothetical protein
MKSAIFFLASAIIFFSCKGQPEEKDAQNNIAGARKLINEYITALKKKDWASLTNLIHPDVFKQISRKSFEKAMNNSMNGDGFAIEIKDSQIDSLYHPMDYQGDIYTYVRMITKTFMKPSDNSSNSNEADNKIPEDFCNLLKEQDDKHGSTNDCRLVNGGVEFSMIDFSYVIFLEKKKKWYLLSKDEDSEQLVNKIIPEEVRKNFGY